MKTSTILILAAVLAGFLWIRSRQPGKSTDQTTDGMTPTPKPGTSKTSPTTSSATSSQKKATGIPTKQKPADKPIPAPTPGPEPYDFEPAGSVMDTVLPRPTFVAITPIQPHGEPTIDGLTSSAGASVIDDLIAAKRVGP
jgi:hypothetical protein